MSKIIEAGDVLIKRFTLANKSISAEVNPIDQLLGADIWEDVTKPTMYAEFIFNDNINLLKNFPIIGEEEITIEIQTPGIAKPTLFKFRTFEIANVVKDPNGKGTTYMLRCVSKEHLLAGSSAIKESYTDIISNMVPIILSHVIGTDKALNIDPTKGIQTIAFSRQNPLKAIDMIRQRAVSKDYTASAYVFFENQAGFNFKTIEGLMKDSRPNIGSRTFNVQQNTMGSKEAQANAFRTIKRFESISRSDTNKKTNSGIYKAVTKTFDLNTKSVGTQDFSLKDAFSSFEKTTTGKAQIPNTDDFINNFGSSIPKQFFTLKDTTRPDNFIDTAISIRNSFAVLLNSDITRVLIHGDSGLKAGDMIQLNFPTPEGTTGKKKEDTQLSGNYLIIRLRHIITPSTKNKHEIAFDCVKMGIA